MIFTYEAFTQSGQSRHGEIEASDRPGAISALSKKGLQAYKIASSAKKDATSVSKRSSTKHTSEDKKTETSGISAPTSSQAEPQQSESLDSYSAEPTKLNKSQVILFTEELSEMLRAGMQLQPSIQLLAERSKNPAISSVCRNLNNRVRDGSSFARALEASSPSFGKLYCSLITAGEASGSLDTILHRQALHLRKMTELKGKVALSMIYPLFLLLSGVAVGALFAFVFLPKITLLVRNTGSELPWIASFLLGVTGFMKSHFILIIASLCVLVALAILAWRIPAVQYHWSRIRLKIPLLGSIARAGFAVQFLETLGTLLGNGVPLLPSLQLCSKSTGNPYLHSRLESMNKQVEDGRPLSIEMDRAGIFDDQLLDIMRVGEETGQMEQAVIRSAQRYDRELEKRMATLGAFIQPVIILMMAAVVGVMAYLMVSVIYDTVSTLRR